MTYAATCATQNQSHIAADVPQYVLRVVQANAKSVRVDVHFVPVEGRLYTHVLAFTQVCGSVTSAVFK